MLKSTRYGALLTVSIILLLLVWRLPDWFMHGNERVIEAWGDGYKAYHAILYHAQYDSTYSQYQGMNYPYGEHIIPGASQPLLSTVMKGLKNVGWQPLDYGFGLIHASLLLSLLLCGLFLFLLLRRFSLPVWLSMLVAIALTFMSPQLARMTSHYGLGHPDVLPLLFYLLKRYDERPRWSWALALAGMLTLYSAIHFYYFAILSLTIALYMGIRWLWHRDWRLTGRYLAHGALALLIPFAAFTLWLHFTDLVPDRTAAPWGFFEYHAYLEGIFTSMSQAHWRWFDAHLVDIRSVGFEGQVYAGLVALGYVLFVCYRWLRHRAKYPLVWGEASVTVFLNPLLLMALVLLLFSLGIPFILPGMKGLIDYAGPIRQFRSIGRFAWPFYYAIHLCAFYELYRYLQRGAWKARMLLTAAIAILLIESFQYQRSIDLGLDVIAENTPGERFTDLPIDYTAYQAILPIPFYYIGSDNFWWEGSGFSQQKSQTLSFQTGLPMSAAMLTRSSRRQGLDQLQLVTEPYRPIRILADYPNTRPLLMVWDTTRAAEEFQGRFDHLLTGATLLHEAGELRLYALPLSAFDLQLRQQRDSVQARINRLPTRADDWITSDTTLPWLAIDYDQRPASLTYQGSGALAVSANPRAVALDTIWQTSYTGPLTLSFWFFFDADQRGRTDLFFQEIDPATGHVIQSIQTSAHLLIQAVDPNGWLLLEWPLSRQQANSRLQLHLQNERLGSDTLFLDELLLRPAPLDIYRTSPSSFYHNGRVYPRR